MSQAGGSNGVKKEEPMDEDELEEQLWGSASESDEAPARDGPFDIGRKLKAPVSTRYSCESLFNMIHDGEIDLEADYQRGVVWSEVKQGAIIDSILRHFYVPPVLFAMREREGCGDMNEARVCIDGKQRLSAIYAFMLGSIPVREPRSGRAFYFKNPPDVADPPERQRRRQHVFTDQQRRSFGKLQISAVEYSSLTDQDERDIFQRVQMGMALSPAEKLAASTGAWPEFCHELEKRFVENDDTTPNKITFRTLLPLDRGKDFLFMAQIALLILNEHENKFLPHATKVQRFFDAASATNREVSDRERSIILGTMTRWAELANDSSVNGPLLPQKQAKGHKKTLSPVEFIFAALMVRYFGRASNRELVGLIAGYMGIVREKHPGNVFLNIKVESTTRMYMRHQERLHPSWVAEDVGIFSEEGVAAGRRRRAAENDDDEFVPSTRDLYSNQRRRLD